jgi:hypothetical protein
MSLQMLKNEKRAASLREAKRPFQRQRACVNRPSFFWFRMRVRRSSRDSPKPERDDNNDARIGPMGPQAVADGHRPEPAPAGQARRATAASCRHVSGVAQRASVLHPSRCSRQSKAARPGLRPKLQPQTLLPLSATSATKSAGSRRGLCHILYYRFSAPTFTSVLSSVSDSHC